MAASTDSSSGTPITPEQLIALNDEIAALIRSGIPLELGLREFGGDAKGALGRISAELVKDEVAIIDGQEVLRRWRTEVGDVTGVKTLGFSGATGGPGGGPAVSLTLTGSNIEQVARAAKELERSPKTLQVWGMEGQGPPACKDGGRVFYLQTELDEFLGIEAA